MPDGIWIGVLARRSGDGTRPVGGLTPFLQKLSTVGQALGVRVVAFDPDDIHRREARIDGLVWTRRRQWRLQDLPLPEVVWNRLKAPRSEPACRYLRERGADVINGWPLDKWQAYQMLQQDPLLQPRLPFTCLLDDPAQVAPLVDRFGNVYLKPVTGGLGRGIIRIARVEKGRYLCQYVPRRGGGVRSVRVKEKDLEEWVEDLTDEHPYLIQQGLRLAVFGGRPADVRVLCQKNGRGMWQVTGLGARVALPGYFTANLHTGGQGMPLDRFLATAFPAAPEEQQRLAQDLHQISLHLCQILERSGGPLGELGIDLGADANGQIWYIEHNYFPGRNIFRHLRDEDTFLAAHRQPLEFACHLVRCRRAGLPVLRRPQAAPPLLARVATISPRPVMVRPVDRSGAPPAPAESGPAQSGPEHRVPAPRRPEQSPSAAAQP